MFLISWVTYNFVGRKFLYFIIIIFFVTNTATQLISNNNSGEDVNSEQADNKLVELIGSRKPRSMPNVYLLVYDAYVTNETMLGYGIDNSAQEEYLETLDFNLYPRTYSISAASVPTMSRVLNASTEFYGAQQRGVSGDGVVHNLLKSFGYETYGLFPSDYFFRSIGSNYKFSFPKKLNQFGSVYSTSSHKLLSEAIFMGEFRFDVGFDKSSREEFVKYKLGVFRNANNPKFIYMHSDFPAHSQNSGTCRSKETKIFKRRLKTANAEMKQDVETIIQNDPGAIIVVAGDHGPYLTKNCVGTGADYTIDEISRLDIQDRLGTFLAIKWPTKDFSEYDDITVLQDLFPSIFAYLFKDRKFLEAKVVPLTLDRGVVSEVIINDGVINGGINNSEPLFINQK